MDTTPGTPTALVIAAIASAVAAFLSLGVTAMVPYLKWRGTDNRRRRRSLRLVGRLPSEVEHWSLRHNLLDAWILFDRRRRRDKRVIRKLERLYRCPRLPPCHYPDFCEACQVTHGREGEYLALMERRANRFSQRQQTHLRRRMDARPWRRNWLSPVQERRLSALEADREPEFDLAGFEEQPDDCSGES